MNTTIWANAFFGWLLQTSWQAGVIVLLILAAQWALRKRLSPAWRYGLWFLLVARLLMPITPRSAVSIFNLASWPQRPAVKEQQKAADPVSVAIVASPSQPQEAFIPPAPASPAPVERATVATPATPLLGVAPAPVSNPAHKPINWIALAVVTWLVGVCVLGLRFLWSHLRFSRRLRRYPPLTEASVSRLSMQCAQLLAIKQRVVVIETVEVDSPAVFGLWRKRLLLPEGLRDELTEAELRHVLLHELAHIKRRDLELNWLLVLLQIVHWFNPLLWFAFSRMRIDRELATDDLALACAEPRERGCYGETVLKVLESMTQSRIVPGLVGIGENKAQIKERILAIARGQGRPRWRWAAAVAAVIIGSIALTNARPETQGIDLLKRYPTTLTAGDSVPSHAREWQFAPEDIFQLSRFSFEVGKALRVEAGPSDLAIGHCADGAVWAVVIPREDGKLTRSNTANAEVVSHVWLRFHPGQVARLFPPETVTSGGAPELEERIRKIAEAKMNSSWQAGGQAMIPEPKDLTVDVDTKAGPRRFFMVDTAAQTAEYVPDFVNRAVKAQPAYEPEVNTNSAQVVAVSPANGARNVDSIQELSIRFDRPMNPACMKLEWLAGGFQMRGAIRVEDDGKQFIVPVRLLEGSEHQLVVNRDQEREMWVAMGRQSGEQPRRSRHGKEGFVDLNAVPANEFRWSFTTKAAPSTPDAAKPRMVSVSPASGSATPVLTMVEMVFDQPLRSPELPMPYLQKTAFAQGPSLIPRFEYDPAKKSLRFAALLKADDDTRLTLKGLYGASGAACEPVVLHYQTSSEALDANYVNRAKASAKDPQLQRLLTSMKEARARLQSGIEVVETITLGMSKNAFNQIEAQTATFKWQGPDQVYADISGPMSMAGVFILGSDGKNCWLYSINDKGEKRLDQSPREVTQTELFLADPFYLQKRSVPEALGESELVLTDNATLEGRPCHRLQSWEVGSQGLGWAMLTEWWIDSETLLLKQIVQYHPNGSQIVRFDYQHLNESLPVSAFQPPAVPGNGAKPLFFAKEPGPDERRFMRVSDGSNGRMSGRLGWHGPGGTTSSGLN